MKSDFDILPAWMKADGFSWDEIMDELRAENPIAPPFNSLYQARLQTTDTTPTGFSNGKLWYNSVFVNTDFYFLNSLLTT